MHSISIDHLTACFRSFSFFGAHAHISPMGTQNMRR